MYIRVVCLFFFFFFNDTATTEIYTLSLHDALPISQAMRSNGLRVKGAADLCLHPTRSADRKSTRLNSSHGYISYAVFCLKKKKTHNTHLHTLLEHAPRHYMHHHRHRANHDTHSCTH